MTKNLSSGLADFSAAKTIWVLRGSFAIEVVLDFILKAKVPRKKESMVEIVLKKIRTWVGILDILVFLIMFV